MDSVLLATGNSAVPLIAKPVNSRPKLTPRSRISPERLLILQSKGKARLSDVAISARNSTVGSTATEIPACPSFQIPQATAPSRCRCPYFPLESLPAELRLEIYSYVLISETPFVHSPTTPSLKRRRTLEANDLSLLLTSKFIHNDAAHFFYRANTFVFTDATALYTYLTTTLPPPLADELRTVQLAYPSSHTTATVKTMARDLAVLASADDIDDPLDPFPATPPPKLRTSRRLNIQYARRYYHILSPRTKAWAAAQYNLHEAGAAALGALDRHCKRLRRVDVDACFVRDQDHADEVRALRAKGVKVGVWKEGMLIDD